MSDAPLGPLDASVIIAITEPEIDSLPAQLFISAITLAELSVGPLVATDPVEQAVRQVRLQLTERDFDAMIAATAITHSLPLYTLNPDDFLGVTRLDVRVPRLRQK